MSDLCNDNRFKLIEKYKKKLIESTNIESSQDEMKVLDNILFRFWQMGWLDKLELPSIQPEPCEDAVSRNAIIQKLNTMDRYVSEELILCDTDKKFPKNEVFIVDDVYEEIVENLPSEDPERKKGKWIAIKNRNGTTFALRCSLCGNSPKRGISSDFCPNCGADMRGEQDGRDS